MVKMKWPVDIIDKETGELVKAGTEIDLTLTRAEAAIPEVNKFYKRDDITFQRTDGKDGAPSPREQQDKENSDAEGAEAEAKDAN